MLYFQKNEFKKISIISFTFLLATYFACIINFPILIKASSIVYKLKQFDIMFLVSVPFFFMAAFNFIFNLFSWPRITKPLFIVLILASSVVSYAMFNYNIIFDRNMIENIMETDVSEATSYISFSFIIWFGFMGVIPTIMMFFIKFKDEISIIKFLSMKLVSMMTSLIVIVIIAFFFYKDYSSVGRNNSYLRQMIIPTDYIYSAVKYIKATYITEPIPYTNIGTDAKQSEAALVAEKEKPTLLVFVLGETARAQSYQANGYERPTNAYTEKLGFTSFKNVSSCGTATAISVPCMYSNMPREKYKKEIAVNQDNFLDIMKRAGIGLYWKENDGGDKGVAHGIEKIALDRTADGSFCDGNSCQDMKLLDNFDNDVEAMKGNRMLTMHLMGSHGPTYYLRYPQEHRFFTPDCPRNDIENCTQEELVNTYDNTILYTDYLLSETVKKLKKLESKYNTALFYISDHGESLGENGFYLHGSPYMMAPVYQTHVPMMLWMSDGFKQVKQINENCLKKAANNNEYSHDNLFHSMLGIMDVETQAYDVELDLFKECRA